MNIKQEFREDGSLSAKLFYDENDFLTKEEHFNYNQGLLYVNKYHPNSNVKKHYVDYYPDGKFRSEAFYNEKGQLHNEEGYALKTWYENGNPETEKYYINGEYREDMPYPYKEWAEDGRLKTDIYKENLHNVLNNELPIGIVEKIQPYYSDEESYEDIYVEETDIEPYSYYWLVEFENGSMLPYPLLALWDKEEHKKEHAFFVDEQQDIIKEHYENRPELKEAFKELELKHLGNMIDKRKTEYTINEVGEEVIRKYRINNNLAAEISVTPPSTETAFYNNGNLYYKKVYDFTEDRSSTYLKEKILGNKNGHFSYHFKFNSDLEFHCEDGPARLLCYENGNIKEEEYYHNGRLHREDGPALINYHENGNVKYQMYRRNHQFHREDGPARLLCYENGNIKEEKYYHNDQLHREDGPTVISYHENGNVEEEKYYHEGQLCREDGPTVISYYENGNVEKEKYYRKAPDYQIFTISQLHREDGPAVIDYYENGSIKEKIYYQNDRIHREDEPAVIGYYENGSIKEKIYYQNDRIHREDEPAIIGYYENGNIKQENYYFYNEYHRKDGPATKSYYENGGIKEEKYYYVGENRRKDGAKTIQYYENGNIKYEEHGTCTYNGPKTIQYYENGNRKHVKYGEYSYRGLEETFYNPDGSPQNKSNPLSVSMDNEEILNNLTVPSHNSTTKL